MKVVGIIGAGVSGLCATRQTLASGLTPVVWEQSADLGGTWRLSDDVGVDKFGLPVHSSMYQNLRCDLPRVMMGLPDFAFPEGEEDFAHHSVVLKYLEDYSKHFNLLPWIKFGHSVDTVSPVLKEDGQPPAWEVTVTSLADGATTTTIVDALCVCNGHFSVPAIPPVTDIEKFNGKKLHSHDYRDPREYVGCRVLILGAGASGLDICVEVSSVADKVYLAHNFPVLIPSELPSNILQVPSVKRATLDGFILNNGRCVEVDTIIYCTGYEYKFPFLSDSCGICVENNQVKPLYKHIINARYSTMGFIGIPSRVVVFPLVYYQVCYFLATLTGQAKLPSVTEMMSLVENGLDDIRLKGRNKKDYHRLHAEQWDYMEDLALCSGVDPPPAFMKKIWGIVIIRLFLSFPLFKTYAYKPAEDGTIVESRNGEILSTRWDLMQLAFKQLVRLVWRDFRNVFWLISSMILGLATKFFKKD